MVLTGVMTKLTDNRWIKSTIIEYHIATITIVVAITTIQALRENGKTNPCVVLVHNDKSLLSCRPYTIKSQQTKRISSKFNTTAKLIIHSGLKWSRGSIFCLHHSYMIRSRKMKIKTREENKNHLALVIFVWARKSFVVVICCCCCWRCCYLWLFFLSVFLFHSCLSSAIRIFVRN